MKQKTKRAIAKFLRVILGPPKKQEVAKEIDWQKVLFQFFTQVNKAINDGYSLRYIAEWETDTEITLCARCHSEKGEIYRIERRIKKCLTHLQ